MDSTDKKTEILATLAEGVTRLTDSAEWRAWLDVQSRFHRYSWRNPLLIALQKPDATQVAGFRAWLQLGRHVGLAIKDEESVQAFGLIWLFPLTFVSSAFVPIATMPGWMQVFANNQPVTLVINAMRSFALGGPQFPLLPGLWEALAWLGGILLVFAPLAVRAYRRAS